MSEWDYTNQRVLFWVDLNGAVEWIVRVQYFVRGGFVGYHSRASSKHLSPHLPVDELDSSGVKKGLRCRCKMHVWVSGPQRNRLDVDVWRSDVTLPNATVEHVGERV
ncbi:hypothetical protein TNCV_4017921 [Trichonephila clavipes]|nr:hypothetical protein TNCV_4017921 [Trichonephila clavipes]